VDSPYVTSINIVVLARIFFRFLRVNGFFLPQGLDALRWGASGLEDKDSIWDLVVEVFDNNILVIFPTLLDVPDHQQELKDVSDEEAKSADNRNSNCYNLRVKEEFQVLFLSGKTTNKRHSI